MDTGNATKLAAGALLVGASLLSGNAALITAAGGVGVNWTSEAFGELWRAALPPHVYVMLATSARLDVARGDQARRYFERDDPDQPLKTEFDPQRALPDVAIVETTGARMADPARGRSGVTDIRLRRALLAIESVQRHDRLVLLGEPSSGATCCKLTSGWNSCGCTGKCRVMSDA